MGKGSVETLEELLGCTLAEARAIYNGEVNSGQLSTTSRDPAGKNAQPGHSRPCP